MPGKKTIATELRHPIRGKGWRRTSTIAADKYAVISAAVLKALRKTPIAFGELVNKLKDTLKDFDGSIAWYALSCLRELEVQGKVTRHLKPVRYSKA